MLTCKRIHPHIHKPYTSLHVHIKTRYSHTQADQYARRPGKVKMDTKPSASPATCCFFGEGSEPEANEKGVGG